MLEKYFDTLDTPQRFGAGPSLAKASTEDGVTERSGPFSGLPSAEARRKLAAFAKAIADTLVEVRADRYTANPLKRTRVGKIFVDYLRNQRGGSAIVNYSTRAKPNASVACPLAWNGADHLVIWRTGGSQITAARVSPSLSLSFHAIYTRFTAVVSAPISHPSRHAR